MATMRELLNQSNLNQLADVLGDIEFGELLTLVIQGLTATEAGVVPAAHVATLANQPSAMFQINATTATVTGIKKLLKGPITGEDAVVPRTGEAVWDGGVKVLFAAADAVTAASFTYARSTNSSSVLQRDLGQLNP